MRREDFLRRSAGLILGATILGRLPVPEAAAALPVAPAGTPVGYVRWLGYNETLPEGWLYCHGQEVSVTQFPKLFQVVGHNYGRVKYVRHTFRVPDYRGRVIESNPCYEVWEHTHAHNHTSSVARLPRHTHSIFDPGHTHQSGEYIIKAA